MRTGPSGVSTDTTSRRSVYRCWIVSRTPSVVVCRNSALMTRPRSSGAARQVSSTPGRFFFMPIGVV